MSLHFLYFPMAENLPEYTECASHGVCNKLDGVCKCNLGKRLISFMQIIVYAIDTYCICANSSATTF